MTSFSADILTWMATYIARENHGDH